MLFKFPGYEVAGGEALLYPKARGRRESTNREPPSPARPPPPPAPRPSSTARGVGRGWTWGTPPAAAPSLGAGRSRSFGWRPSPLRTRVRTPPRFFSLLSGSPSRSCRRTLAAPLARVALHAGGGCAASPVSFPCSGSLRLPLSASLCLSLPLSASASLYAALNTASSLGVTRPHRRPSCVI